MVGTQGFSLFEAMTSVRYANTYSGNRVSMKGCTAYSMLHTPHPDDGQ